MRHHISSLIILSFARMRSRRVFLISRNFPERVLPQMKVKPRKLRKALEEADVAVTYAERPALVAEKLSQCIECELFHTALRPFGIVYCRITGGARHRHLGGNPAPGHGSTFAFTLPVTVKEQARPA